MGSFIAKNINKKAPKDNTIHDTIAAAAINIKCKATWCGILLDMGTEANLRLTWCPGAAAIAFCIMKAKNPINEMVQLLRSIDPTFEGLSDGYIVQRLRRKASEYLAARNGHDNEFDFSTPFTNAPKALQTPAVAAPQPPLFAAPL